MLQVPVTRKTKTMTSVEPLLYNSNGNYYGYVMQEHLIRTKNWD